MRSLRFTCWCVVLASSACGPQPAQDAAGAGQGAPAVMQDAASAGAGGGAPDGGAGPYVEPKLRPPQRSDETQCRLQGTRADALPRVAAEPALAELRFEHARGIVAHPEEPDALYVVEQDGLVHRVDVAASPATAQPVLDVSGGVACCEHGGLRGFALHPQFGQNRHAFAFYVTEGAVRRARVSRFTADAASSVFDPGSERIVLEVPLPGEGREGGPLLFDGDGKLLVALGDGGVDPLDVATGAPVGWLGAILRLDVDAIDGSGSYAIPDDNPFADGAEGAPPEVFAWGFRDPQHCGLDRTTGELWCSDRGPTQSELNRVDGGGHHGWPAIEGQLCADTGRLCLDTRYVSPYATYRHFEGACGVAGGEVHAGAASSVLAGVAMYGDACTGTLSGAASSGAHARERGSIGALPHGVRAFGSDGRGDVLAVDQSGQVFRLVLAEDGMPGTFPERLSETGCYADLAGHEPAPEFVEFRVRSPLWSDGTHKRRLVRLPAGEQIEAPATGPWTFPVGTVLLKEFALQFDDRDPGSVRPIETRFMVHRAEGWEFYNYRWNDDATDAELVSEDLDVDYEVVRAGLPRTQTYGFPGPDSCMTCHSVAPGRVLGPRTEQLNYALPYQGEAAPRNQLQALAAAGLLEMPAGDLPVLPDPADETLPIEQRARSYLHANCAHCHQPGGWTSPDLPMDLRYELPLADANLCGVPVRFFGGGSSLVEPGAPEQSAILLRMLDRGLDRMPPLATSEVDPLGVAVVSEWVAGLDGCP